MPEFCKSECQLHFTDMPLYSILSEWVAQNVQVPADAVTWFAHVSLFLLTWYMIKFTMRVVLSIFWPAIIISTVLLIFHSIQYARHEDFMSFLLNAFERTCHWMVQTAGHIPELFLKLFATD